MAGDLDDPTTRLAQLVAREPVQVRKPEKGTRPKLFYIEGDSSALVPSAAPPGHGYLWADTSRPCLCRHAAHRGGRRAAADRVRVAEQPTCPPGAGKVSVYLLDQVHLAGRR